MRQSTRLLFATLTILLPSINHHNKSLSPSKTPLTKARLSVSFAPGLVTSVALAPRRLFHPMAAPPPVHPHLASGGVDYTTINSIGVTFLQASHDVHGSMERGLNAFYSEQLRSVDPLFHQDANPRDHIHGDAMSRLYDLVIEMVTANADQTPPGSVGRIANIVRGWRFKFEFTAGKYRNLPKHDAAANSFQVFLNRAVGRNETDLMIYIQTEDFYVDPDPMLVITYRNFDHFSSTPFAVLPAGAGGGPAAPARFYFNPAAVPPEVRARYEKRTHSSKHMLGSDLVPFDDTGLDMNYHVDVATGQYFVLRDGTLFELKPINEKGLFREPPKCTDTSAPGFRHWYDLFMRHCMNNGY